jgi:hypothetical protein
MKKSTLFLLCSLISFLAVAQYEGTITWGLKMEITDPKLKAQMEQANKQMSDPNNQAKMKELEEKMNDPQFKAMMEKNPEMKAMIESQMAAMKNGSGGNLMDNMMPKSMEIKTKDGNSLSKISGGAFESEVLYLKDKQESYTIDRKNKTYTVHTAPKPDDKTSDIKVTKTEEFATILSYKCRKYLAEVPEHGQKVTYFIWATTDIKDLDPKQFSKMRVGKGGSASFMEKVDGVPLKIEAKMPQGNMTMEVTSLKKEPIPASLMQIPTGFTEKKPTSY